MGKVIFADVESMSEMVQSRFHGTPKLPKEAPDDYEERTWREKAHVNSDGHVLIPPGAWKNCLTSAAQYLGIRIPGKGTSTYTKNFAAGVMVIDPTVLEVRKEQLTRKAMFVPSDGKRGGGKRVVRIFPQIDSWKGTVKIFVFDDTVTPDVLHQHLTQAGVFIGLGAFRPINNGWIGRFSVTGFKVEAI